MIKPIIFNPAQAQKIREHLTAIEPFGGKAVVFDYAAKHKLYLHPCINCQELTPTIPEKVKDDVVCTCVFCQGKKDFNQTYYSVFLPNKSYLPTNVIYYDSLFEAKEALNMWVNQFSQSKPYVTTNGNPFWGQPLIDRCTIAPANNRFLLKKDSE